MLSDDRQLLDAFRRGDRAALERVYRQYVTKVERLVAHGCLAGVGRAPGVELAARSLPARCPLAVLSESLAHVIG